MRKVRLFLFWVVIAIMSLTTVAFADTTIYLSESAFLSALKPDYFLCEFEGFTNKDYGPITLEMAGGTGNGYYFYEISVLPGYPNAPANFWGVPGGISTLYTDQTLLIHTWTMPNYKVYAMGGEFFTSDFFSREDVSGSVNVSFFDRDGSLILTHTITNAAGSRSFFGIISTDYIKDAKVVSADIEGNYCPTIDHLYVGQPASVPVPEPSLMVLLGISIMSLAGLKRWWKE